MVVKESPRTCPRALTAKFLACDPLMGFHRGEELLQETLLEGYEG